jgi:hypothetical protein
MHNVKNINGDQSYTAFLTKKNTAVMLLADIATASFLKNCFPEETKSDIKTEKRESFM